MQLNPRAKQPEPYFEGWYFKHQTEGFSLALIPAVHTNRHGRKSASLQIITPERSWWLEYPCFAFHALGNGFQVQVGQSVFCPKGVDLNVEEEGLSLHGRLSYGPFTPLSSHIMGPFRFLNMECSHGVLSMKHTLEGLLRLNGRTLDFTGGVGYAETDRGRSFPSAYLWTQCLWDTGSIMLSVATIPLPLGSFTGCICAILLNGREYRMATYLGAGIQRWSDTGAELRQGKYRLTAEHLGPSGQPLRAPVLGSMERVIQENLCTAVRYRFWCGGQLLLDRLDTRSSFEYARQSAPDCFPQ